MVTPDFITARLTPEQQTLWKEKLLPHLPPALSEEINKPDRFFRVLRKMMRDEKLRPHVIAVAEEDNVPMLAAWLTYGCSSPWVQKQSETIVQLSGYSESQSYYDLWVNLGCGLARLYTTKKLNLDELEKHDSKDMLSDMFAYLQLTDAYSDMYLRRTSWTHVPNMIKRFREISPLFGLADLLKHYPMNQSQALQTFRLEGLIPQGLAIESEADEQGRWAIESLKALANMDVENASRLVDSGKKKFLSDTTT